MFTLQFILTFNLLSNEKITKNKDGIKEIYRHYANRNERNPKWEKQSNDLHL